MWGKKICRKVKFKKYEAVAVVAVVAFQFIFLDVPSSYFPGTTWTGSESSNGQGAPIFHGFDGRIGNDPSRESCASLPVICFFQYMDLCIDLCLYIDVIWYDVIIRHDIKYNDITCMSIYIIII